MSMIGFVLFAIGLMVFFFARRIVMAKTKLDENDKEEFGMLVSGAVMAVRLSGCVVAALGFIFLLLGQQ
ncbi:hypothetical protein [Cellulosilyticum ruminicola]|uniref:hypothetical protein n=1 Tax=Cellulosilyticum ruminicola TaxID=425254 RepID=UPI0006D1ADCF|nr:hypothetical protein [Cellulosilyticum ruminicola]